jgi:CheY-like chemotaxis protein/anti-sigma regulatory factor (Ser/Thr protein kinase)
VDGLSFSLTARAKAKGLASRLDCAPALLLLPVAEAVALRQVMENLIDNAVRATSEGEIAITISASASVARLIVSIQDTGPGLPPDVQRALRGASHSSAPSGLGLKISQRLVGQQGGELHARSNPGGKGTTFTFDWPVATERTTLHGEALIVDDHPASRLVTRTILSALGYACIEADGVAAARLLLAERSISVLLTDLRMGEGGGLALLQALSKYEGSARPKALVLSADDRDEHPGLAGLYDGYVQKPITVQALVEALRGLDLPLSNKRNAA